MPHDAPPEDHTAPAPVRLTADDVMTPGPRTCSPFSTVVEAAMIFRDSDCGAVPVLDEGKPVGILTDRDVALALTEHPDLATRPVANVMTKDVITVFADTPLAALREKFGEVKVRRLLVIDPDGGLRGIVAWSDLAAHLPEREVGHVVSEVIERPDAGGTAGREGRALTRPGDEGDQDRPAGGSRWAWAKPAAFWGLLRTTASEWMEDKVPRLGAALAFYSVLSIAPLLIIAIAIAALAFGEEAARGQLVGQMRGMVGPEGADAIQEMIKNARKPATGTVAALLGVVTLLFGASGVFGQLQDAINTIWEVQPKPGRGVLAMLKDRFLSFAMVLGTGFLLLVSLVLSAALAAFFALAGALAPGLGAVLQVANILVSFTVVAVLFALIFKLLPDAKIAWRDVWVGAVLTTVLFLVGKALIGLYLGRSGYGSAYGAAGSLVVLLVWIYYSAQILFFGAEFTQVYANRYGSRIEPAADAEPVTAEARAQQGIPKGRDDPSSLDDFIPGVTYRAISRAFVKRESPATAPFPV
ncbi:MAG: YhjD/YihY/BrkB family envelope integrity protein [Isosphaeraceae bacterium]